MARTKFSLLTFFGASAALAGCSPSPLYVDRAQIGTFGEVPRDGRGEPIWSAIPPAPPLAAVAPGAAPPTSSPQR
jgi:hypothetical protein